ncbi:MAG: hypothetical protein AB1407_05360, partial [Spirochaetota bacterium]
KGLRRISAAPSRILALSICFFFIKKQFSNSQHRRRAKHPRQDVQKFEMSAAGEELEKLGGYDETEGCQGSSVKAWKFMFRNFIFRYIDSGEYEEQAEVHGLVEAQGRGNPRKCRGRQKKGGEDGKGDEYGKFVGFYMFYQNMDKISLGW